MTTSIIQTIDDLHRQKQRLLIAIDGRCAAGKTTFALHLKKIFRCNVVPMDHFFLRPEQRTADRINEPGGNVDFERFLSEALIPMREGGAFSYRPYDCKLQRFGGAVSVQDSAVNLVEGSYSCHPALWGYYDLRIFLTVGHEEQLKRIRERDGAARAAEFTEKWIPLEERYFSAYDIKERCDYWFVS